jgi:hypothetical protein
MAIKMKKELIAPCGMNCYICKYYHREKNTCPGCRIDDENKTKYCIECIIKNCEVLENNNSDFCFDCPKIPCRRLKNLDKRYHTKYHMSMLENLKCIKDKGIDTFLEKETKKWICLKCGGIVTCHGGICLNCGFEKFKN